MAILTGYQKVKKYVKEAGGYKLLSQWTAADTVELSDGTTLQSLADGLGDAAEKDVDTSISANSTSTNLPTSKAVADLISSSISASDAMVFKGTVGTGGTVTALPTTGVVVGDTYKVAEAGTYAGVAAKVGDLFIATATTPTWVYVPAGDETITFTQTVTSGTKIGAISIDGSSQDIFAPTIPGVVSTTENGLVPKVTDTSKFLKGDGTWAEPTNTNTTYTLTQDATDGHKLTFTPSSGTATTVTIPDNDTKVTAVGNHYTPAKSTTKSASGGTLTDIANSSTGSQVVTGVEMDAAGHVTGVTSIALKATNNTYSNKTAASGGTDESLVTTGEKYIWNNKANAPTEASASLAANATSLVISNSAITTSSTIDVFTSVFGVNPTDMVIAAGKVTFTFDSTHAASTIKIRIS